MSPPSLIVQVDHTASLEPAIVGAKAATLARLARCGFPVPTACVVTVAAYREHVRSAPMSATRVLDALEQGPARADDLREAAVEFQAAIRQQPIASEVLAALETAAVPMLRGAPAAIRSSATLEDLDGQSFAGQYESYLNVEPKVEAIALRVRECWASMWSWRALRYRLENALTGHWPEMAVVIQTMVDPMFAGVLFTAHPGGSPETMLISYVEGLGDSLVGGTDNATAVEIGRNSVMGPSGEAKLGELGQVPGALAQLAKVGLEIEEYFGTPQDIEWALDKRGSLAVLQARPITALPEQKFTFTSWPHHRHWDRKIPGEWLNAPMTPLFQTLLIDPIVERTVTLFARELGGALRNPPTTVLHGYLYVRADVDVRRSLMVLLKGRGFLNCMDGKWAAARDTLKATILEQGPKVAHCTNESALELLQVFAQATREHGAWVLTSAVGALVSEAVFARVARFVGYRGLSYVHFLLGAPSASAAMNEQLASLGERVFATPALANAAHAGDSSLFRLTLDRPEYCETKRAYEDFLEQFGHQSLELDIVHPTFREMPELILSLLCIYADGHAAQPVERRGYLRDEAGRLEQKVLASLPPWSWRRWLFQRTLSLARRYMAIRDDRPFYFQLAWPDMRCLVERVGKFLVQQGSLHAAGDVYFLTLSECHTAVSDGIALDPEIATDRRRKWFAQRRMSPPDFVNYGGASRLLSWCWRLPEGTTTELHGHPGAPGKAAGTVRVVVAEPQSVDSVGPSDVLVTRFTTPAWTPLFAQVRAVVTEIGSPLSHAAIVAREFGIPCVVGVEGATGKLTNGEIVTVNGNRGRVVREHSILGDQSQ